jgi:hypothetical protein
MVDMVLLDCLSIDSPLSLYWLSFSSVLALIDSLLPPYWLSLLALYLLSICSLLVFYWLSISSLLALYWLSIAPLLSLHCLSIVSQLSLYWLTIGSVLALFGLLFTHTLTTHTHTHKHQTRHVDYIPLPVRSPRRPCGLPSSWRGAHVCDGICGSLWTDARNMDEARALRIELPTNNQLAKMSK